MFFFCSFFGIERFIGKKEWEEMLHAFCKRSDNCMG
jgi:hypothetical protein